VGPEYWKFLASVSKTKVLSLYRKHINPAVQAEHLFPHGGPYDPHNRWNNSTTTGAMHLIQQNNSLIAEIELAAAATIVRVRNGAVVTDQQVLISICSQYGAAERHSDPHIGSEVNTLARGHSDITLANPIGLCIAGLSTAGWQTPDGSNPMDYWTITRGAPNKALRAVYEVPPGKGFTVGDITINGHNIEFGAQIADFITIKLTGLATRLGKSTVPAIPCLAAGPGPAALAMSVDAALAEGVSSSHR
jgi:hypothetical protein